MTKKKKARLGRGLDALLGDVKATTVADAGLSPQDEDSQSNPGTKTGYRELPVEQLQRGQYQPRVHIDREALEELGESIRSQGIVQPLLVREIAKDKYEIIAGERRWRGAQIAGLSTVPAVVREISDEAAMAVGLIENIQREDLNAMEEARGFQRLLEEFGLTHQQIAETVGRSRTAVSNLIRLLALHSTVQQQLETGEIEMGHARALLALEDHNQPGAAAKVIAGGFSVRQTEQLVKRLQKQDASQEKDQEKSPDVVHLEEELSSKISAKVEIRHGAKKGKLIIHYHSLDELDGILERIQ